MSKIFTFLAAAMMSISMYAANITVAQAVEIGKKLAKDGVTSETYTVEGCVGKLFNQYSAEKKTQSFYMCDTKEEVNPDSKDFAFEAFNAHLDKAVTPGTKVAVTGKITNYVSNKGVQTIEIKEGTCVILEEGEAGGGDSDPIDLPEGVMSCADAVAAAAAIADPKAEKETTKGGEVRVWGYVTYAYDANNGKQSAWLSDTKGAKAGVIQGAFLQVSSPVAVGDYVEISGTLAKYYKPASQRKKAEIVIEVIDGIMGPAGEQGIENVVLTEQAQKVIVDGIIYIVRDNKMYNLQGVRVR